MRRTTITFRCIQYWNVIEFMRYLSVHLVHYILHWICACQLTTDNSIITIAIFLTLPHSNTKCIFQMVDKFAINWESWSKFINILYDATNETTKNQRFKIHSEFSLKDELTNHFDLNIIKFSNKTLLNCMNEYDHRWIRCTNMFSALNSQFVRYCYLHTLNLFTHFDCTCITST